MEENFNLNSHSKPNSNDIYNQEKQKSTIQVIIIPFKSDSFSYSKNYYCSEILSQIITKNYFDRIIDNLNLILGKAIYNKKKRDEFKLPKWSNALIILSLICLILYLLFFYMSEINAKEKFADLLYYLTIISISFGIIMVLFLGNYNFFNHTRQYKLLSEIINEYMNNYIKEVNLKLSKDGIDNMYFYFHEEDRNLLCILNNNNYNKNNEPFDFLKEYQKGNKDVVIICPSKENKNSKRTAKVKCENLNIESHENNEKKDDDRSFKNYLDSNNISSSQSSNSFQKNINK